jgi:hypothetical protein
MNRLAGVVVGAACAAVVVLGCNGSVSMSPPGADAGRDAGASDDEASADAGGASDGGGPLQWYVTCGDPVCRVPPDGGPVDSGPPCPALGTSCTTKGETCGTRDPLVNCGAIEVCDDHDPAVNCPISSRAFKEGVRYLGDAQLEALHDEALRTRLATYRYTSAVTDDPAATHLGFVIEDQPASLAVDRAHGRVDLYGYASMTVAALQVQEKEIAALRREVESMRREVARCQARK